jgi:hypothetical protein
VKASFVPSPFRWRSVIAAALVVLLVVVVVTRTPPGSPERALPDPHGQTDLHGQGSAPTDGSTSALRDPNEVLAPSPFASERSPAIASPSPTRRCVDHRTSIGIADVRIGDRDSAVVTNAAGVFVPPPSAGWTKFSSPEHGSGSIDLSAAATDAATFRLRRVFPVSIRIVAAASILPGASLRLDRLDADAAGVQQNRTLISDVPGSGGIDLLMTVGRWRAVWSPTAGIAGGAALTPREFEVEAPMTVTLRVTDRDEDALRGRLVDARGRPCPGVDVQFAGSRLSTIATERVRTDDRGRFRLQDHSHPAPGGVVHVDVALDSPQWEPLLGRGPFQNGGDEVVLVLEPARRKLLALELDGVVQAQWTAVLHDRVGQPSGSIVAEAGSGELPRIVDAGGFLAVRVPSSPELEPLLVGVGALDVEVERRGENEPVVVVHWIRVRRVGLEVSVVDAVSGAGVPGASVEVLEAPGGEDAARVRSVRSTPIAGLLPTRTVRTANADLDGKVVLRGIAGSGLLLHVRAEGYEHAYVPVATASSPANAPLTVPLRRLLRLTGSVRVPAASEGWMLEVVFTPAREHAWHERRTAAVRQGVYRIDDLPLGVYAVSARLGREPWELWTIPLGRFEFVGDGSQDFDAGDFTFAEVAVVAGSRSPIPLRSDNQVWLIATSGDSVALRWNGDRFGPAMVLPGTYDVMAMAGVPATGETIVAWSRAEVRTAEPQVIEVNFVLERTEIRLLDDTGGAVRGQWYRVPGYGDRCTNADGVIVLPGPLPPGARIHRLVENAARSGWIVGDSLPLVPTGEDPRRLTATQR